MYRCVHLCPTTDSFLGNHRILVKFPIFAARCWPRCEFRSGFLWILVPNSKNIRVKLWLKNEIRCGKNEIVNSDTNPAMNYIQFITIALIYVRRPPFSISFQLAVPKQAMCRALPHILASIQGKTSSRYVGSWAIPFRKFLQLASVSPKSLTSTFKKNQQGIPTLNV